MWLQVVAAAEVLTMRILMIVCAAALLASIASSPALCEEEGTVYLGGFMLLRIRTGAGGFSAAQRVNALQTRANALLELGKGIPKITTVRTGKDVNVYAGRSLFVTVTQADARSNRTTTDRLAAIWAQRLRTILPQATPEKPGVGSPQRS